MSIEKTVPATAATQRTLMFERRSVRPTGSSPFVARVLVAAYPHPVPPARAAGDSAAPVPHGRWSYQPSRQAPSRRTRRPVVRRRVRLHEAPPGQYTTRTAQPRPNRSERTVHDEGGVFVAQLVQLAKHDHLPIVCWQREDGSSQRGESLGSFQIGECIRYRGRRRRHLRKLIELDFRMRTSACESACAEDSERCRTSRP